MKASEKPGFFKSLLGLGRTPPARTPVPLYIPVSMLKTDKEPGTNIEAAWSKVMDQRLGALVMLQEANRYLEIINPMPLPYEQRARLSNIVLTEVAAAIGSLFARFFHQGGGIPETPEQREGISHAVRAAEQLAISYKLLFRQDWADAAEDRPAQEKILTVVLRILECVRLEQLLRAFRYQKLPQHVWRDCNQLFFALRNAWDVRARFPLKLRLAVEDKASRVDLFPPMASVEQLYLSIQLTGLLDVITWPTHLMFRAGSYLNGMEEPLAYSDDKGDAVPPGHIVIYYNQGTPPRFSRPKEQLGQGILIDINPIIERATQDRAALASSRAAPIANETLHLISERDRPPFLDLLMRRLQPRQRRDERHRIFDTRRARVYGGFEAAYRVFRDISRKDKHPEEMGDDRPFWDNLAEHASVVSDSEDPSLESHWVIADEGSGGVQLRQQEGDYSMPLYVGRLVAYSSGGEDQGGSRLGYVVRLQRIGDDEVEVAIARLREDIQAAVVEDLEAMEQHSMPALLIRDLDGKLQLLCDNKYKFITGERLAVMNGDQHYTGALGDIVVAQADFTVFELHTAV